MRKTRERKLMTQIYNDERIYFPDEVTDRQFTGLKSAYKRYVREQINSSEMSDEEILGLAFLNAVTISLWDTE
jgi:hypothetical protein